MIFALKHVRLCLKQVSAAYSVCSPPPCGGGAGGGGSAIPSQVAPSFSRRITPLPNPPPQGGREQTEFAAQAESMRREHALSPPAEIDFRHARIARGLARQPVENLLAVVENDD